MTLADELDPMTLEELGGQLRIESIRLADLAESGHPTSSMSAADLVAVLIARHLRIDPAEPASPAADRLLFSKGHASPLLYAALAAMGILDDAELDGYRRLGSRLEGHPSPAVPTVPAATGSLGLGLPIGVGLALAARNLEHTDARIWVLCGDSEMTEGSMAEAIDYAGWAGLSNLTALVDVNRLGQTGPTRHGWDLDHYARRFSASGWWTATIDGHDVEAIDWALGEAASRARPVAVIARTHKGSGASETDDREGHHGRPLDEPARAIEELGGRRPVKVSPPAPTGRSLTPVAAMPDRSLAGPGLPSWVVGTPVSTRDAFGQALAAVTARRRDVVALDAEVGDSTRLDRVAGAVPDRFIQFHIAEQLQFAAAIGLDARGWRPVVSTFAAFCSRANDVIRMAAIGGSTMLIVGSHAGVSIGQDGPSQMGLEDIAMMRAIHGSVVLSPSDANQTAHLVEELLDRPGISYLRILRGPTPVIHRPGTRFRIGGSHVLFGSSEDAVTVVATGATVPEAIEAAVTMSRRGTAVRLIDAYSIKPIDTDEIRRAARETGRLVVVEDHRPEGGLGEAVLAALAPLPIAVTVRHLAVRTMPGSAKPAEQLAAAAIDAEAIVAALEEVTAGTGQPAGA